MRVLEVGMITEGDSCLVKSHWCMGLDLQFTNGR